MVEEFKVARSKTRHGLILAGLLAATGLLILLFGQFTIADHLPTGALALALSGAIGVYACWQGRRDQVNLRLDDDGIWFGDWRVTVPWRDIEDVYQTGSRLQPFVTIRLRDPEDFIARLSAAEARSVRGNRLWKQPELRIPNGAVEATHREVFEALRAGFESVGDQ